VELADEDYRYGDGRITFYVSGLGERTLEHGAPWIDLKGHRLVRGEQWGPERTITARVAGIRPARPAGGAPLPEKLRQP
jgi:hypothetical protein